MVLINKEHVIVVRKFEYLYFEVWVWGKGGLDVGGTLRMHTMYGCIMQGMCVLIGSMCMGVTRRVMYCWRSSHYLCHN